MKTRVTYQNPLLFASRCYSVVLRCIDFRFRPHLDGLLAQLFADESGLGDYDEIAVAGGAKAVTDVPRRTTTIEELRIAIRYHQAKQAILVAHRDCAAFGGTRAFPSAQAEKEAQVAVMRQACDIIFEAFPELIRVILLFQDKDALEVVE